MPSIPTSISEHPLTIGRQVEKTRPGKPYPMGAQWDGLGVNFALYSAHAERVELLLFNHAEDVEPDRVINIRERTGPIWHIYIPNLKPGQLYGYHVHGIYEPQHGHRFNANKVLLDPYTKAIGRALTWDKSLYGYEYGHPDADLSFSEKDSAAFAPLGMVIEERFEWGDDRPPRIPWEDTIIYETHVKGISKLHPEVPDDLRGTYLGLASDPILEHLKALGVTTIQLLPVHAKIQDEFLVEKELTNYWGYNTLAYFAPEPSYGTADPATAVREFKMMVRALHAAGLEVIIDVVYNHTGEGNHLGPTLSFRGIDNRSYYKLNPADLRFLMDYTGTGNTLDVGNAHVLQLVMDSLRYWVLEMHVDGFRFDLAAALARDLFEINMLAAFFQVVQQDPVLSQVKLIAEPWDVGPGGYQVGSFPWLWTEWNGKYRDTIRQYWRGDQGIIGEVATRLAGSSDLYEWSGRKPYASINFITAHDGYTLHDFVSYEQKHNEENQEGNRDGHNANYSLNLGVEGPTDNPAIIRQREALKSSLMATLLFSQGVPMILGGDELSRTQRGNNNAYCQDNEINWYDWQLDEGKEKFLAYVRRIIAFRKEHPNFCRYKFLSGHADEQGVKDVVWWHPEGREMGEGDWYDNMQHTMGMLLHGGRIHRTDARGNILKDNTFLILFNAQAHAKTFVLPSAALRGQQGWIVAIEPYFDHGELKEGKPLIAGEAVKLPARTVVVLQEDEEY